jgi:hypothetical protein
MTGGRPYNQNKVSGEYIDRNVLNVMLDFREN